MLTATRNFLARHPGYFAVLRKIIELGFKRQKAIIKKSLGAAQGLKVLDIGCGTGEFFSCFDSAGYIGIDIFAAYIAYAQRKNQGNFQVMDATSIQFPDNSFDFILIMAILHHLDDNAAKKVVREAVRLLRPAGKILIMEDARIPRLENFLTRFIQRYDKGAYIRSPEDYRKIIDGFVRLEWEKEFRNGSCLYYAMLLKKK